MKQTRNQIVTLLVFLAMGSIQALAKPFAKGPYLGQSPPGATARIFAPGLISDRRPHTWEAWGTFSADGNTFCFARRRGVFITENTDQGWTAPKHIKTIPFMSACCCLSPDANSVYFTYSYDPAKRYSLHRCTRTSQGWSLPHEVGPPLSTARPFGGFSFSADNTIYFTSDVTHGGRLQRHYQYAPLVGDTWAQGIKIPLEQGKLWCSHPGVAPDESFMVFYSIKPGTQGGTPTDLYLTLRRPDGTWTQPRNMGPRVNSRRYYEWGASISPDKKYLFFNRTNGWGLNSSSDTGDIYWVELKEYLPESHR